MNPPLDAVIFDLGNVLVFHDNGYLFRRFADVAGLRDEPEAFSQRVPAGFWDDVNRGKVAGDRIRTVVCEALGAEIDEALFFAIWNSHFRIHEELLPLVQALVGRVRLALLSNTNELHARFLLPQLPLLKSFDALLLSNQVGMAKPDDGFFQLALKHLEVRPERAAFFDDIPEYVEAARRLGIHGRLFTTAEAFRAQLRELGL